MKITRIVTTVALGGALAAGLFAAPAQASDDNRDWSVTFDREYSTNGTRVTSDREYGTTGTRVTSDREYGTNDREYGTTGTRVTSDREY